VIEYVIKQAPVLLIKSSVLPTEDNRTPGRGKVVLMARSFVGCCGPLVFICHAEIRLPMNGLGKCHGTDRNFWQLTTERLKQG